MRSAVWCNSPPAPLETIRRKNPETDPRYRPVFGSHTQNQDREEEKEEALELTQPMFDSLYRRIELLIDGFDCLCA
jgi:hypothetical protein